MTLLEASRSAAHEAYHLADARIRRCLYRRVTSVGNGRPGRERVYAVDCLHPGLGATVTIGDFEAATDVCNACEAEGTFRPDED